MKKLFKKISIGVVTGCFAFVTMLFISSIFTGGADALFSQRTGTEWLKIATAYILIALGYSIPSLIYSKENIAISLKVLLHMSVGGVVFLLVSFLVGWIAHNTQAVFVYVLLAIVITAAFWAFFVCCLRLQAKKINARIKEKQGE